MHWQRITAGVLLTFALFSLAFGLYRAAAGQSSPLAIPPTAEAVVIYLHSSFRCTACTTIERLSFALVTNRFADVYATGRLVWRSANYQERADLAKRYDVVSVCVVVSRMNGGNEVSFERLDDVWDLYGNPPAFNDRLSTAITNNLRSAP